MCIRAVVIKFETQRNDMMLKLKYFLHEGDRNGGGTVGNLEGDSMVLVYVSELKV
jgi:hypothetical protein